MIRVLVIDDDALVCGALATILGSQPDMQVAGKGTSGESALELYESLKPDLVLMDIRMQGMGGLEAGRQLIQRWPEVKIVFLTTFSDDEYLVAALRMGAMGYLLKQDFDSLADALRAVNTGQRVFGGLAGQKLPRLVGGALMAGSEVAAGQNGASYQNPADFKLTEKELGLLKLVADGLSNREISETLFLGEGTVRNYVSALLEKLDLRDRTQLAAFYFRTLGAPEG